MNRKSVFAVLAADLMKRMVPFLAGPSRDGAGLKRMSHGVNYAKKWANRAHRKRVNAQRRHMARLAGV